MMSELSAEERRPEAPAQEALERAHATGQPIDCSRSSGQIWAIALSRLIEANNIDAVRTSLPRLLEAFPDMLYLQTMTEVFAHLPAAKGTPFADDLSQPVQVVPAPGSDTIVFAFTGGAQRLFLELNLFHRWVACLGVHVVYLRDANRGPFVRGVGSLAGDYRGTLSTFERLAADLGARRICCLGACLGGHAALRYGIDLQAERVLMYSPRTFIASDDIAAAMYRSGQRRADQIVSSQLAAFDLRLVLEAATHQPLARTVVGRDYQVDLAHASNLEDMPNVILESLPGGHNTVCASINAHRLAAQLAWLVDRGASA